MCLIKTLPSDKRTGSARELSLLRWTVVRGVVQGFQEAWNHSQARALYMLYYYQLVSDITLPRHTHLVEDSLSKSVNYIH